jgi:hypothetical protein
MCMGAGHGQLGREDTANIKRHARHSLSSMRTCTRQNSSLDNDDRLNL